MRPISASFADELAALAAHLDAATARFLVLLREFDATPYGWPIPEAPTPPAMPADPVAALIMTNQAQGLTIDGRTALPYWRGERLDLGWAISVLHPAANPDGFRQPSACADRAT